ncbi:MAG: ATP-binding protein [Bacteroidales bacterium]|nr:ATP-binding protein [Bacteroidales bacterium]
MVTKRISKTGVGFLIDASAKTYETPEKQLREFISNSLDAGATKVEIEVIPSDKIIIITDNGCGMNEKEFDDKYLVIGCSDKYGDDSTIGRIGVGKFSAIPLCQELQVRTRKANEKKVYYANLQLWKFMDKEKRTMDVTQLDLGEGDYILPGSDDPGIEFSPKQQFTKMVLKKVNDEIIQLFNDPGKFNSFQFNLGRILPLKYNPESAALKGLQRIEPVLYEELLKCTEKKNVEIKVITPDHKKGFTLYRSLFGDDFRNTGEKIAGEVYPIDSGDNLEVKIKGYLADMTTGGQVNSLWKGLNVRVQNTTVVENYFFDFDDAPASQRITGEIQLYNVDEEDLITMNRSGFSTTNSQYATISGWLTEQLENFAIKYIRKRTNFNSSMKKKTAQLKNQSNVAVSLEKAIREVFCEDDVDVGLLGKNKLFKNEEIDQIEDLKKEFPDQVQDVIPSPDSTMDEIKPELVTGNKYALKVPENFLKYNLTINDDEYELKYVDHDDEKVIIDVDDKDKVIRVNRNSPPIRSGRSPLVLALVLIEYAFAAFPDDPVKLKEKIHEALYSAFQ